MRPDNGVLADPFANFECGITPSELFEDVGLFILEGRVPEFSVKGRLEGCHCWPIVNGAAQACCNSKADSGKGSLCQYASNGRQLMTSAWRESHHICISVYADVSTCDGSVSVTQRLHHDCDTFKDNRVLIEQWKLELEDAAKLPVPPHGSIQMLFQALRSFLHFSQLSAWWIKSQGVAPASVYFRIETAVCEDPSLFQMVPDVHVFPLTSISKDSFVKVTVFSLPRIDIHRLSSQELTPIAKNHKLARLSGPCRSVGSTKAVCRSLFSDGSLWRRNQLANQDPSPVTVAQRKGYVPSSGHITKTADNGLNTVSNPRRCCSIASQPKPITTASHCRRQNFNDETSTSLERLCVDTPDACCANRSTCSTTSELQSCKERLSSSSVIVLDASPSSQLQDLHSYGYASTCSCKCGSKSRRATIAVPRAVHEARRSLRECTLPVFNPQTGLPVSSSPAPLRRPDICSEMEHSFNNFCDISRHPFASDCCCESSDDLGPSDSLLSKSAPASTGLLGNFEESILKGRMPASGTVKGFTIALGASGSFCPAHVNLPVRAHFFRLSDDGMPSPYLGFINLKDPRVGRRGYHVPRRGTVQLTLFNPNKTVVKVFIVLFDLSDMPPNSHTFLRQKIVSSRCDPESEEEQRYLHYLIHLRFASSKKGRIYLHSDIRLLFPRQPPDVHSSCSLLTITDEPRNPRYSRQGRTLS